MVSMVQSLLNIFIKITALSNGLAKNFAKVDVALVECPDLTQPPYNLASKGIRQSTRIMF